MKKVCPHCHTTFEDHTKNVFCCKECRIVGKSIQKYPDGTDYVECKICGYRGSDLHKHITGYHEMTIDDYCKKFVVEEITLQSYTLRSHNSEMQKKAYAEGRLHGWGKGNSNPSRRKEVRDGRKSIFSRNCEKYDGMTDAEKDAVIQTLLKDMAQKKREENNNPLTIEYYIKRGSTKREAKKLLRMRQRTFSLDICIKKLGKDKGKKRFQERQEKWQNTLNSLPLEEIQRINKAKMMNGRGYSKISQELFFKILAIVRENYSQIFFATINGEEKFSEYMVVDPENGSKFFLDFYIKDNNKVIEFDGDYWHGEQRGNKQRDMEREEKLKQLGYINIFHVKERDYRSDPEKVIKECIDFIRR